MLFGVGMNTTHGRCMVMGESLKTQKAATKGIGFQTYREHGLYSHVWAAEGF